MVWLSRLSFVTVCDVFCIRRHSEDVDAQAHLSHRNLKSQVLIHLLLAFSSVVGDKEEKAAPIKAAKTATKATIKSGSPMEEAQTKILDFLFDIHMMGINSAAEEEVLAQSGYAHIKSTGYSKVMKVLTASPD